jgi:predicted HTH transcriptional regulator
MTIEQLKQLLFQREGVEIEYKAAKGGLPGSFWETFSSFANTNGGIIVLGVKEVEGCAVLDRLSERQVVDLKKHFWDNANNTQKVNHSLLREHDVREYEIEDGAWVIAFEIPRAEYNQKPVFLNGKPYGNTFKRNHEGDYHCTEEEVNQMFADASLQRFSADAKILVGFTLDDIDMDTLHKYRNAFNRRHQEHPHPWTDLSDFTFMEKIGAFRKHRAKGEEGFTVAGMLMFGKTESVSSPECLPNFFLDYREHLGNDLRERWSDRIYPDGRWEANLYQFYLKVVDRLWDALPVPFRLADDGVTRLEYTSAHVALREALANSLIHASYTQIGSIVIDRWKDKIEISNPGTMLVSVQQFFEGHQSVCRNPILQKMFVLLGIGEKAGSGADTIVKGWEDNRWERPVITEQVNPERVKITLALTSAPRSAPRSALSWHQVGTKLSLKWDDVEPIFRKLSEPTSAVELKALYGLKDTSKFKKKYIHPLLQEGFVLMTMPDVPTHKNQMYYLSESGMAMYEAMKSLTSTADSPRT